ncbi:putative fatty acid synthase Fas [Mycobacterium xenopi 3993]|nr:putative fatty acid synthase Fas [Mycobacterium xenopi 3993]
MRGLLEPGRTFEFNALFLDPYLWKLQVGGKRLVQKARQSGAPIDGVVVSAGIPELEEAVELIDELGGIGISHVVFKPGTVEQIRAVIRIATEVPTTPVIMHIEGGRAGGHHSWEDLDDLLLATYSELRSRPNITVCVGGGIGTRSGRRIPVRPLGRALRVPVDADRRHPGRHRGDGHQGVHHLAVGQADAGRNPGHRPVDQRRKSQGGMASSRSQLGADIHEIDNAASRCGRLLDEVAGDAEAVAKRRDEIIAAMAGTAKPYFGDVGEMTYAQWLRRYVELTIGDGTSTADTASPGSPWLADTWRDRFEQMLHRAEARLHPKTTAASRPCLPTRNCWSGPTTRSRLCWRAIPTPKPCNCTQRTCRSSSRCARRWASRSTSCRLSTRTCDAGGAAIHCGRPTTRATTPTRCALSPARHRSPASRGWTNPSANCSTVSSRPPSTRCWQPVSNPSRLPRGG